MVGSFCFKKYRKIPFVSAAVEKVHERQFDSIYYVKKEEVSHLSACHDLRSIVVVGVGVAACVALWG